MTKEMEVAQEETEAGGLEDILKSYPKITATYAKSIASIEAQASIEKRKPSKNGTNIQRTSIRKRNKNSKPNPKTNIQSRRIWNRMV